MIQKLTLVLATFLLLPSLGNATPYYATPQTTIEPLAKADTLPDGFYKVTDYANSMVVYILKEKGKTIMEPIHIAGLRPGIPTVTKIEDPRREKIYALLDKAGAASYRGNAIAARDSYREARSLLGSYVQQDIDRKGHLEITVTDASGVKRYSR